MAPQTSRPQRTTSISRRTIDLKAMAASILAPRKKPAHKTSTRVRSRKPPTPPPESSSDDEIEVQTACPRGHPPRERTPINLDEQEYIVSCTANFDDKKVWQDCNSCHLGTYKVQEFNAKAIKAATKEAERMRTGLEIGGCVATISGAKLKQCAKGQGVGGPKTTGRLLKR
jgi:hypothetical protein